MTAKARDQLYADIDAPITLFRASATSLQVRRGDIFGTAERVVMLSRKYGGAKNCRPQGPFNRS